MSDKYAALVKLLCGFNGANNATAYVSEDAGARMATFIGNAKLSTAQVKYDTAALALDGTGDAITFPTSTDFNLASSDFTIEAWLRPSTISGVDYIITTRASAGSDPGFAFALNAGALAATIWGPTAGTTLVNMGGGLLTAAAWNHVALTRSGTDFGMWANGIRVASATSSGNVVNSANALNIGRDPSVSGREFDGYMDEVRMTVGVCRYTETFIPPQGPFSRSKLVGTAGRVLQPTYNLSSPG